MIKSMTGFGRNEYTVGGREYTVEVKTVNHRYLDLNIRAPRQFSFFEDYIRKIVPKYISRGKIDINIQFSSFGDELKDIKFDENLINLYLSEAKVIEDWNKE